jgi:dipeptidyl aminopeptidase/acylaminoacyl peptidase
MGKDVQRLLIFDSSLKLVRALPVGQAVKVRWLQWAGDQALLIHGSNTAELTGFTTNKAELDYVVVAPMDGSKPWQVFANSPDITGGVQSTYGVIQRDGRWYGYFGGIMRHDVWCRGPTLQPTLFEVDLQTQQSRVIARCSQIERQDRNWLVDGNGSVAATMDLTRDDGDWTIRNAALHVIASGSDKLGQVGLVDFTPDGAGVIYSTRDPKTGRDHWFSVPLIGGTPQPYLDDADIAADFEDREHRLLGYISDDAGGDGHFFNAHSDNVYKAIQKTFPDRRVNILDYSDSFDKVVFTTEGPGDPVSWRAADIATGKIERLGTSYDLAEADVGPMKMLSYTAGDGLKMEGVLTLPPPSLSPSGAAKNLPAVILPHGGPSSHDVAGFDWMAQAFASRGYAVFQPNFRGSTGYGAAFERAGRGEWGRKMQTDISDGLAELVKQGVVDPKRVCIVGASYGGYAALAGVTLQQGIYRCAVSFAGIADLYTMAVAETEESGDDPILKRNLKLELGSEKDLKAVSPIRFVDKVSAPILLIHGTDDTVVNIAQSKTMADALRQAGKQVDFIILQKQDHWLSNSEERQDMLQDSVDFVMKNNPPGPGK